MPSHGNTFMGGMDKDTAKPKYPNNKYPDSQNVRPVTDKGLSTGALENIKGTEEIFEMLEIKGMLVIEAVSPILIGPATQTFNLNTVTSPGMDIIEQIPITEGASSDTLFDEIERILTDNEFSYTRLLDEDRIVIYFPTSSPKQPVRFNGTDPTGTLGNLTWELYPAISDFRIIGHTPLRDTTILFTVNDNGELGWDQTSPFSQIWSMSYDPADPKGTAKVDLIYNGQLGFSREYPIEAIARYENTEVQRVYFTDNFNVPRTFNAVRDDTWALRINDFSLITQNALSLPLVTTEEQEGGYLSTGRWYVTYRLRKFGGSASALAPFSSGATVTTSKINSADPDPKYWDYAYATTTVQSTKILNYLIPFIPIGFDEIVLYVVHEPDPGNFQAYLYKTETLTSESSYEFALATLQGLEEIPIEDLKQYDIDFERVKTLTAKHNRLLFGNVKESSFEIDFDARAYRFDKNSDESYITLDFDDEKNWGVVEDADAINPMNKDNGAIATIDNGNGPDYRYQKNSADFVLGGTGPSVEYKFTFKEIILDNSSHAEPSSTPDAQKLNGTGLWPEKTPFVNMPGEDAIDVNVNGTNIDIGPGFSNFKNGRLEAYFKGYMRDEVYRFGIVFYSKTGRQSDVKWVGDIRMPCTGDFGPDSDGVWEGALAQWHSENLPKITTDAYIPQGGGETKGWMLGLEFTVDISTVKEEISGFSIVRAPRKQKDKTILATGALGEIASRYLVGPTSAVDIQFHELGDTSVFKAQKEVYWAAGFIALPNPLRYGEVTTANVGDDVNIYIDAPASAKYQIRCEDVERGGEAYNNGGGRDYSTANSIYNGSLQGNKYWAFTCPTQGTYKFNGSVRQWSYIDMQGVDLEFKEAYALGLKFTIAFKLRFRIISNGNSSYSTVEWKNTYDTHNRYATTGYDSNNNYEVNARKDSTFLNPQERTFIFDQAPNYDSSAINDTSSDPNDIKGCDTFTLKEGDIVKLEGFAILNATLPTIGGTNYKYMTFRFGQQLNHGTGAYSTNFECVGQVGEGSKKKRLFNYTRVIDGNTFVDTSGNPVYGGPGDQFDMSVFDDWTVSRWSDNIVDATCRCASDDFRNIGDFAEQYATLDCPDLKFITGTKVRNSFAEEDADVKYTLKPIAGYVHISEENSTTKTPHQSTTPPSPFPTPEGKIYDENTAASSDTTYKQSGFTPIGHIHSDDPATNSAGGTNDNQHAFIKYFSRYTKALALVYNVPFTDRLHFNSDGYGKIKELSKVESGQYVEVKTGVTGEDTKFLNVGFCTNQHRIINMTDAGSAPVSKGVFTVFLAGLNTSMTKFLINYAFGYKADKDKDPYLGKGNLEWNDGHKNANTYQHNTYIDNTTVGNRIGFYDALGNSKKIPRRGQVTIVDICQEVESQYGGDTHKERKDNEYISVGHFTLVNNDSPSSITTPIFGGDIYQSAFGEKKLYSTNFSWRYWGGNDRKDLSDLKQAFSPIVGRIYPIQSVVNAAMRVGYHFNNYMNYPDITIPANDPLASSVELIYEGEADDYLCPVLYLVEKKLQTYLVTGQNILTGEFDNRIYASQTKINGELFDSWTVFKPLDYLDVDGHYGPINKLEVFNDQVLFFQDKAFGLVSLNPQSIITDISGGEVQLGTGRGLVAFRYISNAVGAFHQWGIVKAKGAMYFFDAYHRKFFRYAKGAEPLSDLKGMSSWIYNKIVGEVLTSDNPILFQGVTSVYDQRFSEVIFTFHVEIEEEAIPLPPNAEEGTLTPSGELSIPGGGLVSDIPCGTLNGKYGPQTTGVSGGAWVPLSFSFDDETFIANEVNAGGTLEIDFSDCTPGYKNLDCYKLGKRPAWVVGSTTNRPLHICFDCPTGQDALLMGINLGGCSQQEGDKVKILAYCAPVEVDPTIPEATPAIKILPKTSYTLVYNEMIDAFSSFYSHFPRHYVSDSKRIFSQPPTGYPVYMHDAGVRGEFYGETFDSIIELLVNPKGTWTKVFNNIEYLTQASNTAGGDLLNVTFDTLRVLNEYQDSGDITLVVDENVRRRMRTWRTQVPRDGKARIRNPYVTMKFTYENNANNRRLIIHDILTHYMDAPM